MKAALCVTCSDIVTPFRDWQANREWRWCQCDHVGVRWRDGAKGLLELASLHGAEYVRALGFNNAFLIDGVKGYGMAEDWRKLHEGTCRVIDPHYLFHSDRRNCWAVITAIGESGDVFLIPFPEAKGYLQKDDATCP